MKPTSEQFLAYQAAFDYFNAALFDGRLPPCVLNFSRKARTHGFFCPDAWAKGETKAAEISLAKAMAQQLAKDNIRVNSVAPGSILFPGGSWDKRQKADPVGIADFIKAELPFGRFGRAEEVGDTVAFLASPRASWISGSCVTVDGCQSRSQI